MAKQVLMIGIGYTALFVAIFLIVFGVMNEDDGLFTTGMSIISFAFGIVMKELFPQISGTINYLFKKAGK
jgi:ABC-type Co2+ transport system permease subunit